MPGKYNYGWVLLAAVTTLAMATEEDMIPADKSEVDMWFTRNVLPLETRNSELNLELVEAETNPICLNVRADGTGQYISITDAIQSIPDGNKQRFIINIGPGTYTEKIRVEADFVTFYGDAENMPTIVFDGKSKKFGTENSATVLITADYFVAVNVIFKNSAPFPTAKDGDQAVALTIQGDMASFYRCKFIGFQDTLCDNRGNHFFMDCYIEGTVDFIFGDGTSIYLRTELHVIPGNSESYITAHGSNDPTEESGYSFVHSCVTGMGGTAYLGRPWRRYAKVVFAYSELTDVIKPQGWDAKPDFASTVYFGEYQNTGLGSDDGRRASYTKELSNVESQRFMTLSFIKSSGWLLPPPGYKQPSQEQPSQDLPYIQWTYSSRDFLYSASIFGHVFSYLIMYLVL